jgi:hypothetical protein
MHVLVPRCWGTCRAGRAPVTVTHTTHAPIHVLTLCLLLLHLLPTHAQIHVLTLCLLPACPQGVLAACPKLLSCQPESVAAKVGGLAEVLRLDAQQARDLATK